MEAFFVPEPELIFRDGNKCADAKVGILKHGPNGLPEFNYVIELGIIGTRSSVRSAYDFVHRLQYNIPGTSNKNSNVYGVDFPGLDKDLPIGFYFNVSEENCEIIPDGSLEILNRDCSRKEKIIAVALAFKQALIDLSDAKPKPSLVMISLPKNVIQACKDPHVIHDDIKISGRSYDELLSMSQIPREQQPLLFDIHDYLKVISKSLGFHTQIIKPQTLEFESDQQDAATIAWNFTVAAYYKSTRSPWKLADLNPETVHIGISFYKDIDDNNNLVVRAAMAQVYMRTGDSQIIRSHTIPITEAEDLQPNLSYRQANEILSEAIRVYKNKHHNANPYRIVVHKKSPYIADELEGFRSAANGIEIQDYLHVVSSPREVDFRVITPTEYPIARGSVFSPTGRRRDFFIFTTGYIPAFDTYPGSRIPLPLRVIVEEPSQSTIRTLALDLMHLTKLDWNTASYYTRMPVTIAVSDKVGDLLGEYSHASIEPPTEYSYFM